MIEYRIVTVKVRDAAVKAYRETCSAAHVAEVAYSDAVAWAAKTREMKDAAQTAVVKAKETVSVAEKQEQWAFAIPLDPLKR